MKTGKVTKSLAVSGMSCPNCELRIENKLKKLTGIISVKASYTKESISLVYDGANIKESEIVAAIEQLDYKVKSVGELNTCLYNSKTSSKLLSVVKAIGILAAIVIILIAINNAVEIDVSAIGYNMGYGILFVVGVVTSLHCITMCGGINLSLCMSYKVKNNDRFSK